MLSLQNSFSGMMSAFAAVLLFDVMVVLGYSISSMVKAVHRNFEDSRIYL